MCRASSPRFSRIFGKKLSYTLSLSITPSLDSQLSILSRTVRNSAGCTNNDNDDDNDGDSDNDDGDRYGRRDIQKKGKRWRSRWAQVVT